jgi:urease subunit gamma/beta
LTPRERERLLLAAAADLARRRLARGAPLGSTEAVALVCDEVCELAWDGVPLAEVIDRARTVIPPGSLLPGVAGLVPVLEVEALFPWGSTLVHVDAPFAEDQEQAQDQEPDPERVPHPPAAPRSPAVTEDAAGRADARHAPGAVLAREGVIALAAGAVRRRALLRNTGPRDVWISSHFPLAEANPAVQLRWSGEEQPDLPAGEARGLRLDLPAGEALLLRAGEEREVTVVVRPA